MPKSHEDKFKSYLSVTSMIRISDMYSHRWQRPLDMDHVDTLYGSIDVWDTRSLSNIIEVISTSSTGILFPMDKEFPPGTCYGIISGQHRVEAFVRWVMIRYSISRDDALAHPDAVWIANVYPLSIEVDHRFDVITYITSLNNLPIMFKKHTTTEDAFCALRHLMDEANNMDPSTISQEGDHIITPQERDHFIWKQSCKIFPSDFRVILASIYGHPRGFDIFNQMIRTKLLGSAGDVMQFLVIGSQYGMMGILLEFVEVCIQWHRYVAGDELWPTVRYDTFGAFAMHEPDHTAIARNLSPGASRRAANTYLPLGFENLIYQVRDEDYDASGNTDKVAKYIPPVAFRNSCKLEDKNLVASKLYLLWVSIIVILWAMEGRDGLIELMKPVGMGVEGHFFGKKVKKVFEYVDRRKNFVELFLREKLEGKPISVEEVVRMLMWDSKDDAKSTFQKLGVKPSVRGRLKFPRGRFLDLIGPQNVTKCIYQAPTLHIILLECAPNDFKDLTYTWEASGVSVFQFLQVDVKIMEEEEEMKRRREFEATIKDAKSQRANEQDRNKKQKMFDLPPKRKSKLISRLDEGIEKRSKLKNSLLTAKNPSDIHLMTRSRVDVSDMTMPPQPPLAPPTITLPPSFVVVPQASQQPAFDERFLGFLNLNFLHLINSTELSPPARQRFVKLLDQVICHPDVHSHILQLEGDTELDIVITRYSVSGSPSPSQNPLWLPGSNHDDEGLGDQENMGMGSGSGTEGGEEEEEEEDDDEEDDEEGLSTVRDDGVQDSQYGGQHHGFGGGGDGGDEEDEDDMDGGVGVDEGNHPRRSRRDSTHSEDEGPPPKRTRSESWGISGTDLAGPTGQVDSWYSTGGGGGGGGNSSVMMVPGSQQSAVFSSSQQSFSGEGDLQVPISTAQPTLPQNGPSYAGFLPGTPLLLTHHQWGSNENTDPTNTGFSTWPPEGIEGGSIQERPNYPSTSHFQDTHWNYGYDGRYSVYDEQNNPNLQQNIPTSGTKGGYGLT